MKWKQSKVIFLFFWVVSSCFLPRCYGSHFFLPNHHGGSPFLTDDPETVPYKHWEFYLFSALDGGKQPPIEEEDESGSGSEAESPTMINVTELAVPAIEANYTIIPNVEAHIAIPFMIFYSHQAPSSAGIGDIEAGFQYRFIQETDHIPQVGIFPVVELPTGAEERNLGNGRIWYKLPIWIQKSWGKWEIDTGGGYVFNGAPGAKNSPYGGFLLQREIGEKLMIGAEIFVQGATDTDSSSYTVLNAGAAYDIRKNFSLLFSLGHTIKGDQHTVAYLGLYWTGPEEKEKEGKEDNKENKNNQKVSTSKVTNRQLLHRNVTNHSRAKAMARYTVGVAK